MSDPPPFQLAVMWGAALLIQALGEAHGQPYPARPIRWIVPSSPGGGTDITARFIAPKLSEYLGQQVVVENRAGANTMIGTQFVARSIADGYTLLLVATGPFITNPAIYNKVPYDPMRDFAPVTLAVSLPNILVVHPSLPVRTVKELISLGKSRPGQLSYASAGTGSAPHLSMELFLTMTGLKIIHVPYKGAGPGVLDVLAGHIVVMMPSIVSSLAFVRDGRLRGLAVTSAKRASAAPDIPTIAETALALAGYDATVTYGVAVPAGTAREIIMTLYSQIARVLQQPEIKARFLADGAETVASSPDEYSSYMAGELTKWTKVINTVGIKVEQ